MQKSSLRKYDWFLIAGLPLAGALLIWMAPPEQTLGQGIKSVYIHVALTWTGMAGITLAGLLGLAGALTGSAKALSWARTAGWVAIGIFGAGLATSAIAAWVNWGGVFWDEPRLRTGLNTLALALIVQILASWLPWKRISGLLYVAPVALLAWSTINTPLVLHPRNPILTSASSSIQLTFLGLSLLFAIGATWLVLYLQRPNPS